MIDPKGSNEFLTITELATLLRSTPSAIYQMRYRGEGPAGFRVGRRLLFDPEEVARWLGTRREVSS